MAIFRENKIGQRLKNLKAHLEQENSLLVEVIDSFQDLDRITLRLGFSTREESFAVRTPWWPLISVLGLYSSGKSTFINHYLDQSLQATGNQAVDNKFTVICFSRDDAPRVLPGLALDADPRFPLYKISEAIEEVAPREGRRVDAYLQLKTCSSGKLRGKILIDSPGFDADAQRSSTLRITDHIINLSDLVLVFFDARHPESGSMEETLDHLVKNTIHRPDSSKFLYILNQIDATANEDNPEEVFAAWQRALAQYGMTAGRCYSIFNDEAAPPIQDPELRNRFKTKRDKDLAEIHGRIEQVKVERAYRIVGMLEQSCHLVKNEVVPRLRRFRERWRRNVLLLDAVIFGGLLIAFLVFTVYSGYWEGMKLHLPGFDAIVANRWLGGAALAALLVGVGYLHHRIRRGVSNRATRKFLEEVKDTEWEPHYRSAFEKNTRWWQTVFRRQPAGWGSRSERLLEGIIDKSHEYVQKLNDRYTNPSGEDLQESQSPPPHQPSPDS